MDATRTTESSSPVFNGAMYTLDVEGMQPMARRGRGVVTACWKHALVKDIGVAEAATETLSRDLDENVEKGSKIDGRTAHKRCGARQRGRQHVSENAGGVGGKSALQQGTRGTKHKSTQRKIPKR